MTERPAAREVTHALTTPRRGAAAARAERVARERAALAWPLQGDVRIAFDAADAARVAQSPCLSYEVDGAPVPKGRPRFGKGHAFTPKRTRDYEARAREAAAVAVAKAGWPAGGWDGRGVRYLVRVDVLLQADRGDADNYAKSLIDAANGVVFPDDARVCAKFITRRLAHGLERPRAAITVYALGTEG